MNGPRRKPELPVDQAEYISSYSTPVLTYFGNIRELTKASTIEVAGSDNGSGGSSYTAVSGGTGSGGGGSTGGGGTGGGTTSCNPFTPGYPNC